MSADELRAAAERLTRFAKIALKGTPSQAPAYRDVAYCEVYRGTLYTQVGDFHAVAAAHLAEHAADAAEPITLPRLVAAGFTVVAGERPRAEIRADGPDGVAYALVDRWQLDGRGYWPLMGHGPRLNVSRAELYTMGEVRSLCRALGIPLAEPPH